MCPTIEQTYMRPTNVSERKCKMNGTIRLKDKEALDFASPIPLHQFYKVIEATFVWVKRKPKTIHKPLIPVAYIAKKIVRNKHHVAATSVDYGF